MQSIGEKLSLPFIFFITKIKQFIEEQKVKRRFYVDKRFQEKDRALLSIYSRKNPYLISKRFLKLKGFKDVHTYGETPLTSLEQIGLECGICSNDTVVELGCGIGRGVLFLAHRFGCSVLGIEWIPEFVAHAAKIAEDDENIIFSCEDMFESDLQEATVIYLYGTSLDDASIQKLIKKFKTLSMGTKIITVSYPLIDYESNEFNLIKEFTVNYPWGKAQVYLQTKI
jgi:SAM-dependent methyltransferase